MKKLVVTIRTAERESAEDDGTRAVYIGGGGPGRAGRSSRPGGRGGEGEGGRSVEAGGWFAATTSGTSRRAGRPARR